ncbi:ribosomal-protein-S5p-alanine acetyltransferase [Lachnospiraceae bacterium KM106-2]|nr:ribosomal-protein-S5p-alanine acetyltransferase [Lachnospiraceae bacterium KM106-2]
MNFEYNTEHLLLKPLNEHYARSVLAFYQNNREYFEPWEPARPDSFYTVSYQSKVLNYEYKEMLEGRFLRFYIFHRQEPLKIIGSICFQNILKGPYQNCSIGYKIDHDYVRNHYGQEAVACAISAMFHEHHMHRIEAYISANNTASIKFINKLGFTKEGTALSFAKINDQWLDFEQYALINPYE